MHPQYRFIPFHFASYVTLHSSRIMSAALSVFSGCSFAQPLGLAPLALCPKSRNATGCLIFFPRRFTLLSLHYSSQGLRFILGLAWLFDCRNTATALLTTNNFRFRSTYFLFRCLGVFNFRLHNNYPATKKINKKKAKVSFGFKK